MRPPSGATNSSGTVSGSMATPAWMALNPSTCWDHTAPNTEAPTSANCTPARTAESAPKFCSR